MLTLNVCIHNLLIFKSSLVEKRTPRLIHDLDNYYMTTATELYLNEIIKTARKMEKERLTT